MDLRDYLKLVRRRWLSLSIVVLATLAVTAGITMLMTPTYTANTRVFFSVQGGQSVTEMAQGSNYAEKQMQSYAEVATSPLVLNPVITQLQLSTDYARLSRNVSATVPLDTVILEVVVDDADPRMAAGIANAVGSQLSKVVAQLAPQRLDGTDPVRATILAPAQVPMQPSAPNVPRNLAVGLFMGLLLGIGIAVLREAMDTNIRTEQDVLAVTEKTILGVIPFDDGAPNHPVVMHDDPLGARSEAVRRLRTNLQFVDVDGSSSMVITSSVPGEGKSTTAINVAVSLADAGLRVLLVDADLRRPAVAQYLGMEGGVGLTTVLIGKADVADVVQPWQETMLDILPSGQIPPNPSELLGSKAMSSLLTRLAETYDMIILDSSPLLPVTDAAILSGMVSGTLVVVGADRVHRPQLRHALESLATVEAKILGVVLNRVAKREAQSYGYYAGYEPIGGPVKVMAEPARADAVPEPDTSAVDLDQERMKQTVERSAQPASHARRR